jgi:hypothetical protein
MRRIALLVGVSLLALTGTALADDPVIQLHIKDHAFVPKDTTVPQGQKIKLVITNEDPSPAEFESYELHREKVVAANSTITFFIGPLDAGTYPFFDDFHHDTTTGTFIAN